MRRRTMNGWVLQAHVPCRTFMSLNSCHCIWVWSYMILVASGARSHQAFTCIGTIFQICCIHSRHPLMGCSQPETIIFESQVSWTVMLRPTLPGLTNWKQPAISFCFWDYKASATTLDTHTHIHVEFVPDLMGCYDDGDNAQQQLNRAQKEKKKSQCCAGGWRTQCT